MVSGKTLVQDKAEDGRQQKWRDVRKALITKHLIKQSHQSEMHIDSREAKECDVQKNSILVGHHIH